MDDRPYFITVEEARTIAFQTPPPLSVDTISIDAGSNRVLAEDLPSRVNDPPFDNSAMDGFACRFDDEASYPLTLDIVGLQAASGVIDTIDVKAGQAVRIMTGAPMPPGTDAILPIERCNVEGDHVTFLEAPKPHFVRKMGENLKKGVVALTKGMRLTPSRIGLCATMGYATVPVYRRLRIGIVSTGDELKSRASR